MSTTPLPSRPALPRPRWRAATVLAVGVLLAGTACTARARTATVRHTLSSGRTYYLHEASVPLTPRPLVVVLHPLGSGAPRMQQMTQASPYADAHRFVVAYAEGVDQAWNAGSCCGDSHAADVAYLRAVVADVGRRVPVDRRRVYVWGFSNGGMMAWRAACEAPDVFAAAGVVGGHLLVPCGRTRVRVRHLHGTADTRVPITGGYAGWCGCTFPDARTERHRVGRGSIVSSAWIPGLGHAWPHGGVAALWRFSSHFHR
jgi:poly(3-hydroxybutyrate) depolymerase